MAIIAVMLNVKISFAYWALDYTLPVFSFMRFPKWMNRLFDNRHPFHVLMNAILHGL